MGIFRPDVGTACGNHYKKLLKIKATCRKILKEREEKGEEATIPTEMTRHASSSRTDGYRNGAHDEMNACIVEAAATEFRGLGWSLYANLEDAFVVSDLDAPQKGLYRFDTRRSHDAPYERSQPQSVL
jgi:hypothetical protein